MKKVTKFYQLFVFAASITALSSCATVFTGTSDRISFNSNPSGATVFIDGIEQCKTPCSVKISRSVNDKEAELKLDGYETRIFTLSKEFNVVSVVNLGNLVGWAIDVVTGSVMKYDKKVYEVTFEKKRVAVSQLNKIEINTEKNTVDLFVVE